MPLHGCTYVHKHRCMDNPKHDAYLLPHLQDGRRNKNLQFWGHSVYINSGHTLVVGRCGRGGRQVKDANSWLDGGRYVNCRRFGDASDGCHGGSGRVQEERRLDWRHCMTARLCTNCTNTSHHSMRTDCEQRTCYTNISARST